MCYRTNGNLEDNCPGHNNNACRKVHCKCIGSHYQQSSYEDCSNCKTQLCICEQQGKQCRKEMAICDCGMTCQEKKSLNEQSVCCRTSGKSKDTCPGHNNNACKKVHCKCIGSHYQQSSYEDCSNCKIQPCIWAVFLTQRIILLQLVKMTIL